MLGILMLLMVEPIPVPHIERWPGNLEPMGWEIAAQNDDAVMFLRGGAKAAQEGRPRVWVRYEYGDVYRSWRSYIELDEFDCAERRTRTIQTARYRGINLGGASEYEQVVGQWHYPIPGTFGESVMLIMCPNT